MTFYVRMAFMFERLCRVKHTVNWPVLTNCMASALGVIERGLQTCEKTQENYNYIMSRPLQ